MPDLLSRTQAAASLGINRAWLWRLEADGRLPKPRQRKFDGRGRAVYTTADIAKIRRKLTALTR